MKVKFVLDKKIFALTIFVVGFLTIDIIAQEVPANLQAALFKKIFSFDKTLASKGVEVGVLGGGEDIVAAFKEAGINAKAIIGSQVPSGVSVVYVGTGVLGTKQQSVSKGVLSISGNASYAELGKVAVGIGIEGGKPKIIINLEQLKAEGHEISSELLKIAKVIQ